MDILAKKKAAPKSKKTAVEGSLDSDARAAGDKKRGQTKGLKVSKRQPSFLDSDSDSDFGSKPSKSVAAKVCTLPPLRAKGYRLFWQKKRGRGRTPSATPNFIAGWREGG